jgi:hypothetical protein
VYLAFGAQIDETDLPRIYLEHVESQTVDLHSNHFHFLHLLLLFLPME